MRYAMMAAAFVLAALSGPVQAAETDPGKNGESIEMVRKTCECVRRHPSGFPYIEPRITTCKVAKNGQGHVKSMDCLNCYALCTDKPAS